MDLRRAQYDRWHRRQKDPQQGDPEDARAESYRLRSLAWSSFYRFRLTADDAELTNLGWNAVEEAAHVANATTEDELREKGEHARSLIDNFVNLAARQLNGSIDDASTYALGGLGPPHT